MSKNLKILQIISLVYIIGAVIVILLNGFSLSKYVFRPDLTLFADSGTDTSREENYYTWINWNSSTDGEWTEDKSDILSGYYISLSYVPVDVLVLLAINAVTYAVVKKKSKSK